MSMAKVCVEHVPCHSEHLPISCTDGSLNTNQNLGIKVATPVGTLIGQLVFGWLADHVGRKRMCKLSIRNVYIGD